MMPQLGVLASVHPEPAAQVFERDCLIYLGTVVAPSGKVKRPGQALAEFSIAMPDGNLETGQLAAGDLKVYPIDTGREAELTVKPARRFDVGAGPGNELRATVRGGVTGLILDGRGRPLAIPGDHAKCAETMKRWLNAMGLDE
jgi:hypothetical protein